MCNWDILHRVATISPHLSTWCHPQPIRGSTASCHEAVCSASVGKAPTLHVMKSWLFPTVLRCLLILCRPVPFPALDTRAYQAMRQLLSERAWVCDVNVSVVVRHAGSKLVASHLSGMKSHSVSSFKLLIYATSARMLLRILHCGRRSGSSATPQSWYQQLAAGFHQHSWTCLHTPHSIVIATSHESSATHNEH